MLRGLVKARSLLAAGVIGRSVAAREGRIDSLSNVTNARRLLCNKVTQGDTVKGTDGALRPGGYTEAVSISNLHSRIPSAFDIKVLLWSGRFKREEDIPQLVSLDMLSAATNNLRVKICYLMIALSIVGCFIMVIAGKNALKNDESLTKMNLDKKAKLKEDYRNEQELIARKAE